MSLLAQTTNASTNLCFRTRDPNFRCSISNTRHHTHQQVANAVDDMCIEVTSGTGGQTSTHMIHPIDVFPANHAIVQNTICGQVFQAGAPIPSTMRPTCDFYPPPVDP